MGTYYKWICRERREQIDPGTLGESVKWPWGEKTLRALRYAMQFGPWLSEAIELLSDCDDLYYEIRADGETPWSDLAEFCLRGAISIGDEDPDRPL